MAAPDNQALADFLARHGKPDDAMAEVLRRKTPAERIAIGSGLWRSARKILRAQSASLHPDWDARRLEREIVRRLSHGAV
jgi:hypothetical protein